jgi:hypothetical protein
MVLAAVTLARLLSPARCAFPTMFPAIFPIPDGEAYLSNS